MHKIIGLPVLLYVFAPAVAVGQGYGASYDAMEFQNMMGDDYYDLPGDAPEADRVQYARIVSRNLFRYISNSHNQKKRALDQRWSDGEIDSPQREAILATLNETTEALRYEVRGSGYESMLKEELLVFAQQTMGSTNSSYESFDNYGAVGEFDAAVVASPLADALENCSRYSENFLHPMTGDPMMRQVERRPDGCLYRETMPGGYQMACLWTSRQDLAEVAAYFRDASGNADMEFASRTEFVGGQPVTRNNYMLGGVPVENPMQASVDAGLCEVGRR